MLREAGFNARFGHNRTGIFGCPFFYGCALSWADFHAAISRRRIQRRTTRITSGTQAVDQVAMQR